MLKAGGAAPFKSPTISIAGFKLLPAAFDITPPLITTVERIPVEWMALFPPAVTTPAVTDIFVLLSSKAVPAPSLIANPEPIEITDPPSTLTSVPSVAAPPPI